MPPWNFFAFDAGAVEKSILTPAQAAVRNRDRAAWEKIFDLLNGTHFPPHVSQNGYCTIISDTLVNGIVAKQWIITRGEIPDELHFGLRRTLQTFIEFVSPLFVQSRHVKLRNLVMNLTPWDRVLDSQDELDEIRLFQDTILVRRKKLPDPFWCLESNEAADTNYADPDTVARMAQVESKVGVFRRLVRRTNLDENLRCLAPDLSAVGFLIELAATRGYGLYFREDGT